jgi:surface antigen
MRAIGLAALVVAGLSVAACMPLFAPRDFGPTFGDFLGNQISAALNPEDKRRAYAAQMQALEAGPSGVPVPWRNPDSGRYGNVVPGPAYQLNGRLCRQYTHSVYIDGTPQIQRGTACRNPDGGWTILG